MARRNPSTPHWATTILEKFSPGELQAGAFTGKPRKLRDGTITIVSQRSRGTRIPASTWKKMKDGTIKPGPKTLAKLSKFKERYQYNQLRATGASIKEAKKLARSDFTEAKQRAAKRVTIAKKIARGLSKVQNRKINYEWILYHMMHSDRSLEDWEDYGISLAG